MQEKLRILAENKVLVSAGVVVIFVCSVVYFLFALGFIKVPENKGVVESASTGIPVDNSSSGLSDPSAGTKTALELNAALKSQQSQQAVKQSQALPALPSPTKAASGVITPTVTPTIAPTATPSPTPTVKPSDPTATPTPTPTATPTVTPTMVTPTLTPNPTLTQTP